MANRIHIAYIWHGNQPAWRRQLDLVQPHDIVVLNAAAALWTAGFNSSPTHCAAAAAQAIEQGAARELLARFATLSHQS